MFLEALPYLVVDSLTRRCLSLMMQQVSNMTQEAVHQAEQLFYEKVRQPKRDPREIQEYQKAYAQTDYVRIAASVNSRCGLSSNAGHHKDVDSQGWKNHPNHRDHSYDHPEPDRVVPKFEDNR